MKCFFISLTLVFLFASSGFYSATYYKLGDMSCQPSGSGYYDITKDNISPEQGLVTVDQANSPRPSVKGRQIKWQIISVCDSNR